MDTAGTSELPVDATGSPPGIVVTRSFGRATAGHATHLDAFRLRDGAVLYIATAVLADRTGIRYGGPVQPDLGVEGPDEPRPGVDDAVIEAAVRWLTIQPSCARAMASIP